MHWCFGFLPHLRSPYDYDEPEILRCSSHAFCPIGADVGHTKVEMLKPSRYVLVTSISVTSDLKEKIINNMPDAPLVAADIFGQEDLNNFLGKHPEIEKKHFKLWLSSSSVMERMLRSSIYHRTDTEMDLIRRMVPKFVQNDSVREAEKILSACGSLIIAGDPGVGKTTLARMLVWLHASEEWKIFVVDDIVEAFEVAPPGEKRLIFFDDFLGQVRLSADHVRGLDQRLPPFLERVKNNTNLRFILTTRQYILSQAQLFSHRLAASSLNTNQYVLNVGVYSRTVRARILYNHLYFSGLRDEQLSDILDGDYYLKIIDHKNFNPRLIELLSSEKYSLLSGKPLRLAIERTLANPRELWERPYRDHISLNGKAMMLALLLHDGAVHFNLLKSSFDQLAEALGQPIALADLNPAFATVLKELEGSVIAISGSNVSFSNPGVRDFLQSVVIGDNVLPSIVANVKTYVELQQCWLIYFGQQPVPLSMHGNSNLWLKALRRVEQSNQGELLKRLDLALNIFDHFQSTELLWIVIKIGKRIREFGIDGDQVRNAVWSLESITFNSLPSSVESYLRKVLTGATADMLKMYGSEMPFEDIEAVDEVLNAYGSDQNLVSEAVRMALDQFIPEIGNEMDNIADLEELDDFEKKFTKLIEKLNYKGGSISSAIERKREELEEIGIRNIPHHGFREGNRAVTANDLSDEDIRSMFQELNLPNESF